MTVMNYYDDVESWQSHRLFAVGSSLLALILTTVSVASPSWIQGEGMGLGLSQGVPPASDDATVDYIYKNNSLGKCIQCIYNGRAILVIKCIFVQ